MQIRRLTTGRVRGKRRTGPLRYLPGGWSDETLPVHAFAVEHPEGVCLFDTGQTARAARGGYHPRWHPFLRLARFELEPKDEVASQLDPRTVRWVVLSHLHTDHVGGLPAFTHATVLVSRVEWERAQGLRGRLRGYIPQHWPHGARATASSTRRTTSPATGGCSWCRCPGTRRGTPACSWRTRRSSPVTRPTSAGSPDEVLRAHD